MKVSATITLLLLTSLSHPMLANDVVIGETFSPTNEVPIVESLT